MSFEDVAPLVPAVVTELSVGCVQFVQASLGVELDFTHETLPILDHYARIGRGEIEKRPEALALLAQSAGAYFGQVLAAELQGFWRIEEADPNRWLLCLSPVFLAINPVGVAYDVFCLGTGHPGPSSELRLAAPDRELVQARLDALPQTSEEDYFSFSTRFDAVQIAFDALRAHMIAGGQEEVTFEAQDYVDEFDL